MVVKKALEEKYQELLKRLDHQQAEYKMYKQTAKNAFNSIESINADLLEVEEAYMSLYTSDIRESIENIRDIVREL